MFARVLQHIVGDLTRANNNKSGLERIETCGQGSNSGRVKPKTRRTVLVVTP